MRRRRPKTRPTPVGDVLPAVLQSLGLEQRLRDREPVAAWSEIVGGELASRSRAVVLENGVLILQADHGVWRQEIGLLFPRILEKYRQVFGPERVRELRWDRSHPRLAR